MSAPHSSTASISTASEVGTSSTTSRRVDWRNYDYSEGPPKAKSAVVTTRDTNPYSKREDFQSSSRSSVSTSSYYTSNFGSSLSNEDFRLNHSYSGAIGASDGVGSSGTLTSNSSFNASSIYLSARSFDDSNLGKDNRKSTITGFTSPSVGAEDTVFSGSSLTYRPAKAVTTPPTDIEDEDDYDEEEEMRIPKVRKYAENLSSPARENHRSPFDYNNDEQQSQEHEEDEGLNQETATPKVVNDVRKISSFEEAWSLSEIEQQQQAQQQEGVSDYGYNKSDDIGGIYRGRIQFDDFAGDRSKASSINGGVSSSINEKYSDTSVSRMDVPMTVAPVSILKNSRKFDSSAASSNPSQSSPSVSDSEMNKKVTLQDVPENINEDGEDEEEDDTIFEFPAHPRNMGNDDKQKRKSKSRSGNDHLSEEDDTSIEYNSPKKRADSLKDRTKQAWSARNKATAAAAKNNSIETNTTNTKKDRVSFNNDATVREFDPRNDQSGDEEEESDSEEESDDETEYTEKTDLSYEDDDTYAGRSMHSIYTKSYESETEDFIKDIFLIGRGEATNPGRRQLRYKKGRKELYREMYQDDDTVDDTVDGTVLRQKEESEQGSYSLGILSNLCDDSLQALSDVLGFNSPSTNDNDESTIGSQLNVTTNDEWYKHASRIAFYADEIEVKSNGLCGAIPSKIEDHLANVEALQNMSLNAARIKHSSRNLKYDETQSMNIITDVRVVRMVVGIPIGIGFDENEVGCVVKRIFENGNTVNASKGDRIEISDHLASINGINVYKKNVTQICNILAGCENTEEIQLVFLRYIGPIRNSNAEERQEYEVIDPKIGRETTSSPLKLAKSLSNVTATKSETDQPQEKQKSSPAKKKSSQAERMKNEPKDDDSLEEIDLKMKRVPFFYGRKKTESQRNGEGDGKVEEKEKSTKKKRGFGFFRNRRGNKKKDAK